MAKYFPDLANVTKALSWVVIVAIVIGLIYISVVNGLALNYRPERIVQRFISLIENPTQTVTDDEKAELEAITQSGFFRNWGNENNVKILRRISQNNPITYSDIEFSGVSGRIASSVLTFENDFTNPNSKTAKIYMERYGTLLTGIRWRIFQIDMPQEDNVIDNALEQTQEAGETIQNQTNGLLDRVRGWFGSNESE